MTDARFEDGAQHPLHLIARDAEDVGVVSALLQDAVFPASDATWRRGQRRFVVLLTRFRWEDRLAAEGQGRAYERVRSLLVIEDVLRVRAQGVDPRQGDVILSLLSIEFAPGPEGSGTLTLTLAGDGAIALDVETLEVRVEDVTRPHRAAAKAAPDHGV